MKITRGPQENTQTNKNDHTCARSSNTKEKIQDPWTTKDDTRVAGLLHEEVLNPWGDLPLERGLESKGIISEEAAVSRKEEIRYG